MAQEESRARQSLLLQQEMGQLEEELTQRYYELGRDVYEATERGVAEINRLVDRLVEAKVKYAALCEAVTCPACLTLNSCESVYCCKCGARLPAPEMERTAQHG